MLVVACGRRFLPTEPPLAMRSGRLLADPPEMVIGVELPACFFGSEDALYMLDEPQLLPVLPPRRLSRAFSEDFA